MTIFEDIKAKTDIVQLVGQYVKLKKAGRNFKGLCPFHNEKTPSFMVSPEKQIAYCFGCHKGGDIFKFTELTENMDMHEAVELLAEKAGVDTTKYDTGKIGGMSSEKRAERKEEKELVREICTHCASFYEAQLWEKGDGQKVLEYLRGRGVKDEIIKDFQIGFAPDSYERTYEYLIGQGCSKDHIISSGQVSVRSTDSSKVFDRFRLRLMFPIWDKRGRVIGFGGRKLKGEDEPKYLNSPDTPVYNKSRVIYGWNKAVDAVKAEDKVIFVEGYFDVIALHQAGYKNAVATSGTAITDEQLKFVKRFTKNVYLTFDSDSAGQKAALRATDLALKNNLKVYVVSLGDYKDPDEVCKADKGLFEGCLKDAKYYLDHYFDEIIEAEVSKNLTSSDKIRLCEKFFEILLLSSEDIEIKDYLEKLSFKLHIESQDVHDKFHRFKVEKEKYEHRSPTKENPEEKGGPEFSPIDYFFGFLMTFPEAIDSVKDVLAENDLEETAKNVYKALTTNYNGTALDTEAFFDAMDGGYLETLKVVSLLIETQYGSRLSKEELCSEAVAIANRVKKLQERNQKRELKFQMKEARSKGMAEEEEQFFKKYSDLIKSP
ncbi:DNA primase [Candidatus Peregrinibacteria bacterium]|jgi:DNA primase|nr:DNA primase [Candidatus Peregrinibacteria bacterium]